MVPAPILNQASVLHRGVVAEKVLLDRTLGGGLQAELEGPRDHLLLPLLVELP